MQPRTQRQREIFDYVTRFIERQGYEPSYQQIAKYFRIKSKAAVAKHIAALEAQGLLKRRNAEGKFSLKIMPEQDMSQSVVVIPFLETLNDKIIEEPDAHGEPFFLPKFMLGNLMPENLFAFRVLNDAMLDEHILEGDIALFERRYFARNGELVLALINKKRVVLKRFYDEDSEIELEPANPAFETIRLAMEKVIVVGVFRALLRPAS
jgi:repressor LexA